MTTIRARFRTHALAIRAFTELEPMAKVSLPVSDPTDVGRPWSMVIVYSRAQQPVVLATVGRYGGVTFREDDHGEG